VISVANTRQPDGLSGQGGLDDNTGLGYSGGSQPHRALIVLPFSSMGGPVYSADYAWRLIRSTLAKESVVLATLE
jgi:hypothetical protein